MHSSHIGTGNSFQALIRQHLAVNLTRRVDLPLTMNLPVDRRTRHVKVYATVMNRRTDSNRIRHCLEFARLGDEIRRSIKDFVLEQMAHL